VSRFLRDGGRVALPDSRLLVWSVAEGRRGRRWRTLVSGGVARGGEAAGGGGTFARGLLLEVDLAGRPTRLELTTPAGLLTLHPEPDGRSIHGNVVSPTGVRPLAFAWSPDHELAVADDAIAIGLALHRRRGTVGPGESVELPVLAIDPELEVAEGRLMVTRTSEDGWLLVGSSGERRIVALDRDGVPASDERWPLE